MKEEKTTTKLTKIQPKTKKELKTLMGIMDSLPKTLVNLQLNKIWKNKTQILEHPEKHLKEITKLQNQQTKIITYKHKSVHDWLEETKTTYPLTDKQHDFIEWYRTKYPMISLTNLTKKK